MYLYLFLIILIANQNYLITTLNIIRVLYNILYRVIKILRMRTTKIV